MGGGRLMPSTSSCGSRFGALGLSPSDRVLVTGATGWFGRTFQCLVPDHPAVLALSSSGEGTTERWSDQMVRDFRPTVVANFAFLTRDLQSAGSTEEFISTNRSLTRQFLFALDQPSVRRALTVSSGAVLDLSDWYGQLKAAEEEACLARLSPAKEIVVIRAYSVSGPFVRRAQAYALSDFVSQAEHGNIHINAEQPSFRRYTSVSDLLRVALLMANQGWSGILESGGELVEMQDLAEVVRREVNPAAVITRVPLVSTTPQVYASDDSSWRFACRQVSLDPQTLEEQVRAVRDFLRGLQA